MIKDRNLHFLHFLQTLAQNIITIEAHKRRIYSFDANTFEKAFQLFDRDHKDHISLGDVYKFLNDHSIIPTEDQMFTIFKQLDSKKKGLININDFAQSFRPLKKQSKTEIQEQESEPKIERYLEDYFQQIIENHRRLEKIKIQVNAQGIQNVFNILDYKQRNVVSLSEIEYYLLANKIKDNTIIQYILIYFEIQGLKEMTLNTFKDFLRINSENYVAVSPNKKVESMSKESFNQYRNNKFSQSEEFENLLRLKSKQNEQRRNQLKQHEKIRNRIMQDVMERKKKFNTLEKDMYQQEQLKKQNQYRLGDINPLIEQKNSIYRNQRIKSPYSRQIDFDEKVKYTQHQYKYLEKQNPLKKAKSQAQFKIQQIERRARERLHKKQIDPQLQFTNHNFNVEELLKQKNYQLQCERNKRMELEKQLMKSKYEIQLLKSHLQSREGGNRYNVNASVQRTKKSEIVDSPNYYKQNKDINKTYKDSATQFYTPNQYDRKKHFNEQLKRLKQDLYGLNKKTEGLSTKIASRHNQTYDPNYKSQKQNFDHRGTLQQALKRSKIQREFAKLKLQKQLQKTRFWK